MFVGDVTVGEHLAFHARLRLFDKTPQQRADRVAAVLARLRLVGCVDTRLEMLSGGEKKRVEFTFGFCGLFAAQLPAVMETSCSMYETSRG